MTNVQLTQSLTEEKKGLIFHHVVAKPQVVKYKFPVVNPLPRKKKVFVKIPHLSLVTNLFLFLGKGLTFLYCTQHFEFQFTTRGELKLIEHYFNSPQ